MIDRMQQDPAAGPTAAPASTPPRQQRIDASTASRPRCADATQAAAAAPAPARRRRRLGWLARVAAVAAAAMLVAACSSIRLGYNNADTLLLYSLDSYFDLDDQQEALAKERVRALLGWHRRTQLGDYAQFLDGIQRRLDAGTPVSPQDVLATQAEMGERMLKVATHAAPDLATLARTLTPAQLEHFRSKLAKDTAKLRRDRGVNGSDAEVIQERAKRNLERARTWLGPLTREQESIIREASARRPGGDRQWIAERERRQQELVALLQRIRSDAVPPDSAATMLVTYVGELSAPRDAARRQDVLAAREANAALIADLINRATPEQKAHLLRKLRGYSQDLVILASEGARG